MRKRRVLAAGVALGMALSMGAQAFGAAAIEKIQAYANNEMTFEFDGERAALPEGYRVIVHEGRSYVPAKFVAERLGAEVTWNEETKVIAISSAAAQAPEAGEPEGPADTASYKKLPQTQEAEKFRLAATSVYEESNSSNYDKLYLTLHNKSGGPVVLEQSRTVFTAGGRDYAVPGDDYGMADQNWYQGVMTEKEQSGYVLIPRGLKDIDRYTVELTVRSNGEYPAWEEELSFDIDAGGKK